MNSLTSEQKEAVREFYTKAEESAEKIQQEAALIVEELRKKPDSPELIQKIEQLANRLKKTQEGLSPQNRDVDEEKSSWAKEILPLAISSTAHLVGAGVALFTDQVGTALKVITGVSAFFGITAGCYDTYYDRKENDRQMERTRQLIQKNTKEILQEEFNSFLHNFKNAYPEGHPKIEKKIPEVVELEVSRFFSFERHFHHIYSKCIESDPEIVSDIPAPTPFERTVSKIFNSLPSDHPLLQQLGITPLLNPKPKKNMDLDEEKNETFPGEKAALDESPSRESPSNPFKEIENRFGIPLLWIEREGNVYHRDGRIDKAIDI